MSDRKVAFIFGILAAVSVSAYLVASAAQSGPGFPLDDAWIHQTYARNLATLGEWSFIPGEPSAGSTSPLWSLLLSIGHILGLGPYVWTYLLGGVILWAFSLLAFWAMSRVLPGRPAWAWAAGILFLFEWHLVWAAVSGMETALFTLVAAAILMVLIMLSYSHQASQLLWLLLGLLIGISVWVRPEGLTLLGPILLGALLLSAKTRQRWKSILAVLLGFILLFGLYLMFNRQLAGEWWPNTFYAKQAEYAILRESPLPGRLLQQFTLPLIGVGLFLLPGFIIALWDATNRMQWGIVLPAMWVIGHLSLYALRLPVTYQHGRYAIPAIPLFLFIGLIGMANTAKLSSPVLLPRFISRVWVTTSGAILLGFWVIGLNAYVDDVTIIETEMVDTARWIAENTEANAIIAAHDIGAIGYFAPRTILDLAGLVSPDVVPFIRDETRLSEYINDQGGQYLMTFPNWYPQLIQGRELIYQSNGQLSFELAGENMSVYRWFAP
ncbi:MAG: hypothetical protein DWQ07_06970 [Chloroflexi bacterium]|nr:MAG: hypothetical protein DWQ07_06970 [Chloroflexota bacterium]MBL1195557.1 hypothetical protein [Chloroflexota bacterium]NOH12840.1 hypothetical protein [Chloroflexota bacterium]